ncbi:MAG TPA: DUF2845 domain-containing protein [Arenimonas sp.]|uniref:DUF2845 domain-containing protein n=1 Tax=Arenimonas sp. TaxID=1872635 RepID=UPI002CEAC91D|nr:DUF2845 domain-containing protein [Arenimonas sp.]HMB57884.1 DUF2845 domain-containing protein [Arenimonas sp.]
MRKLVFATAVLLTSFAAQAADSVQFGQRVITVGDRIGKVYEVAGEPTRIVPLEKKPGAAAGQRFEYVRDGKTISLTLSGGVVVRID